MLAIIIRVFNFCTITHFVTLASEGLRYQVYHGGLKRTDEVYSEPKSLSRARPANVGLAKWLLSLSTILAIFAHGINLLERPSI